MALMYSVQLPIGSKVIDFKLPATDGQIYSPKDFLNHQGLLVIFTCNHCPYAKASLPILIELYKEFGASVPFVAINPNDEVNYPDDSFSAMKDKAKEWGISFPYLRDDTQEVAKSYQAQCTPDVYLYENDNGLKLFYHGRINDNWQEPDKVIQHSLRDALKALVNAEDPPKHQRPSMGCSIKWKNE
ncbi:MAG: thioredoxin family protein [Candidatus Buchananbacteria bacterium CG10_big_fil_rev_8_21_14_0_10_42_9]|uniref:Thioredoxin family protein n=1 Tax=Candidatus Buchananbacteria bacterium CG10_big_fil_rev_8_21_14_0_10_42_9 TaxID=1974526 RepID=A0A2H0W4G4_9BACT|nr:MAG: thioredoxin family protein [Candidatus Buchananbacteria bacterium CG10_big_fil_rev_8_21_14_0_10_42_9]